MVANIHFANTIYSCGRKTNNMIGFSITLAVLCIILMAIVAHLDSINAELSANNKILSGRLESASKQLNQTHPLTVKDIEAAIEHCGYKSETSHKYVTFTINDTPIYIYVTRLPVIGIFCDYTIDKDTWDIGLIQQAAHLMSDAVMMAKAIIINAEDKTILRFLVVAMDRNYNGLCDNLMRYIDTISESVTVLKEKYHSLEDETRGPTVLAKQITTFRYEA